MSPHFRRPAKGPSVILFVTTLGLLGPGCPGSPADPAPPISPEPVPVFLMAGQSNMEGYGPLLDADVGDWALSDSLETLIETGEEPELLLEPRDDVWVHFDSTGEVQEPGLLAPGFGANQGFLGPELGMGTVLGDAWEGPVVLYKAAVGGTTLGGDWLPPSAAVEADLETGEVYSWMMNGFQQFVDQDLDNTFPDALGERGYRLAGFVWLQGWNDQFEDGFVPSYAANLEALVSDVRSTLNAPDLPAIIVEGPTLDEDLRQARLEALAALEASQTGPTVIVTTEDLVQEELEGNFHFHFSASNYLEVGRRTAAAIQDLP